MSLEPLGIMLSIIMLLLSFKAITPTIKAKQRIATTLTLTLTPTTAVIVENYNPKLSRGFTGVKQLKSSAITATTATKTLTTNTKTCINSILIMTTTATTTKIEPTTFLRPVKEEEKEKQKLMLVIRDQMAISEAKLSNFNENSLQKQYKKERKQVKEEVVKELPISTSISTTRESSIEPQQRHYKYVVVQYNFDDDDDSNKHPPCDYNEHAVSSIVNENIRSNDIDNDDDSNGNENNSNGMSVNLLKSPQIGATAKGYKPLVSNSNSVDIVVVENNSNGVDGGVDSGGNNENIAAFSSSSAATTETETTTTTLRPMKMTATTAFNVERNGFRDKINISNQRNEFSNVDDDSKNKSSSSRSNTNINNSTNELFDDAVVAKIQQQQQQQQQSLQLQQKYRRSTTSAKTTKSTTKLNEAESSFFERVELLESTNLSSDGHHELLLHRRKRYLVFPEGSSFQLVFDLIIGIVDYTSYAILGITCSVAWELPSKPPSEIIESFRDKLNEGSFGLQRRNDTIGNGELQYVDTSESSSNITKLQKLHLMEAKFRVDDDGEGENGAWKPQFKVSNYYNKPQTSSYYYDKGGSNFNRGSGSGSRYYKTGAQGNNFAVETQRKTLNEKEPPPLPPQPPMLQNSNWYKNYAKLNTNIKYYSKNNNNNSPKKWSFDGKQKYAALTANDWFQQQRQQQQQQQQYQRLEATSSSSTTDGYHDNVDASDNDDYMPDRFGPYQRKQQTNYAGFWQQKDNWWERNKQRLQSKWRNMDKQQAYADERNDGTPTWNGYAPKRPITAYARPFYNNNNNSGGRSGRQRKILTAPPKHRIYPVFGRRKRSLSYKEKPLTRFEVEMERIHFRAQLESRQKLFGKIEQVFKTRGHNGTECVLRALCETGQRQHQHEKQNEQQLYHHHHQDQHRHQNDEHRRYNRQPHSTAGQQREPQSFITELLRAIFALPRDIVDVGNNNNNNASSHGRGTRSGTGSSNGSRKSTTSDDAGSTSQLDLEFELQQHQQREFESQIPTHYRAAHTYAGNCALRFANCKLSIWEDVAVTLDNGFSFGYGSDSQTVNEAGTEFDATSRHTFEM